MDLREQVLLTGTGIRHRITIAAAHREQILQGLDDITSTLAIADTIRQFEQGRLLGEPWV